MVGVAVFLRRNVFWGVLDFFRINNNHRVVIITADGIINDFFKCHKRLNISKWGGGVKCLTTTELLRPEPLVKSIEHDENLDNNMDIV
jgi:hypothetical protein